MYNNNNQYIIYLCTRQSKPNILKLVTDFNTEHYWSATSHLFTPIYSHTHTHHGQQQLQCINWHNTFERIRAGNAESFFPKPTRPHTHTHRHTPKDLSCRQTQPQLQTHFSRAVNLHLFPEDNNRYALVRGHTMQVFTNLGSSTAEQQSPQ